MIIAAANFPLASTALAQSYSNPQGLGGVSQQLAAGANRVGSGAVQMGEGVRQAAILTWQAVVAGVSTTASRLSGTGGAMPPAQRAN